MEAEHRLTRMLWAIARCKESARASLGPSERDAVLKALDFIEEVGQPLRG